MYGIRKKVYILNSNKATNANCYANEHFLKHIPKASRLKKL